MSERGQPVPGALGIKGLALGLSDEMTQPNMGVELAARHASQPASWCIGRSKIQLSDVTCTVTESAALLIGKDLSYTTEVKQ